MSCLRSQGRTQRQIADELGISRTTVVWYLCPGARNRYGAKKATRARERKAELKLRPDYKELRQQKWGDRKERWRKWQRENKLTVYVNGKQFIILVRKRPRPETCEICNLPKDYLAWHHWNPEYPALGVWACRKCHGLAEAVDNGSGLEHIERYLMLKEKYSRII